MSPNDISPPPIALSGYVVVPGPYRSLLSFLNNIPVYFNLYIVTTSSVNLTLTYISYTVFTVKAVVSINPVNDVWFNNDVPTAPFLSLTSISIDLKLGAYSVNLK